jgi:hypothetical protein
VNPCGRVVDYLRSCYTALVAFDPSNPGSLTEVTWFEAAPDALPLGVPTVFCSANWDDGKVVTPIGEQRKVRGWVSPVSISVVPGAHQGICGSASAWMLGGPPGGATPINPLTGLPFCCGSASVFGLGARFQPGEVLTIGVSTYLRGQGCGIVYGGQWYRVHPAAGSPGEAYRPGARTHIVVSVSPGEATLPREAGHPFESGRPGETYPVPCMHANLIVRGKPGEVYGAQLGEGLALKVAGGEVTLPTVDETRIIAGAGGEVYDPAFTATVVSGVLTSFCGASRVNATLTALCTAASSGVASFNGASVTLTYNSSTHLWTGSLTVYGGTGTISLGPSTSATATLSGTASGTWLVGPSFGASPQSCGPPYSGTFTGVSTSHGMTSGTTSWVVSG